MTVAWTAPGSSASAGRRVLGLSCLVVALWSAGLGRAEGGIPPQSDEHTVALLHFDDMQGEVARDSAAGKHDAMLETWPGNPEWYEHGRFGGCLSFDGINQDGGGDGRGDADGLIWMNGCTPEPSWPGFTVEMWVRHAHVDGWQFYVLNPSAFSFVAKKDKIYSGFKPAESEWVEVWSTPCLKVDLWQHIALTYDGETVRLFCDGSEVGKTAVRGSVPAGREQAVVGHDSDLRASQIRGMCGMIDELRVSSIARTQFPTGPYQPKDRMTGFNARPSARGAHEFREPEPVVRDVVVTGIVFEDGNGNGRREINESGLRDVEVTNGETIIRSGAEGDYRFQFNVEEYRLIYVTLPNGFRTTSPWYQLIDQDGTGTEYTFDFGLQRDPASLKQDFSFLVTADSQFASAEEGRLLREDMAQITRTTGKPRFHVICGDLTMTGWLSEWRLYADAMAAMKLPNYHVFGGHGGNYLARTEHRRGSVHHFNLFCGPSYYSWNYGGRHFVVTNSVGYMSDAGRARQEAWIKADLDLLEPGTEVIGIGHYPVRLATWRGDLKQVAGFYGHWHENYMFRHEDVPYLCTNPIRGRDWGSYTRAMRFCRLEDGVLQTEIRPTGQHQRVQFIQPYDGQHVPRGRVPFRVAALDTASRVTGVTAEIVCDERVVAAPVVRQLGQFTWGSDWDTTQLPPATYECRVTVRDDRSEVWPVRTCRFRAASRLVAQPRPGADWPAFFRSLDGLRAADEKASAPLDLVWSVPTGGRNQWATSPIVFGSRVYVGPENMNTGDGASSIQCYDAGTGAQVWRTEVDSPVRFSLAAAAGHVFAQTHEGMAWCLDAATGAVKWQTRAYPHGFHARSDDTKCAPHLHEGKLITYCERGPLTILDAATGKKLTEWSRPGPPSRDYFGGPFPGKDRIWLATLWGAFACDRETGEVLWETKLRELTGRGVAMAAVKDGICYVRGYNGVAALNAVDGRELWRVKDHVYGVVPTPTVADGILYAGGQRVSAIDGKTGEVLWRYEALREPDESNRRQVFAGASTPLTSGGLLFVGRDDGDVVALDRRSGERVWRHPLCLAIKSSPVVSGNMLFVYDFDGNLSAFASASGD